MLRKQASPPLIFLLSTCNKDDTNRACICKPGDEISLTTRTVLAGVFHSRSPAGKAHRATEKKQARNFTCTVCNSEKLFYFSAPLQARPAATNYKPVLHPSKTAPLSSLGVSNERQCAY